MEDLPGYRKYFHEVNISKFKNPRMLGDFFLASQKVLALIPVQSEIVIKPHKSESMEPGTQSDNSIKNETNVG